VRQLAAPLATAVRDLGRAHGATLFVVLLAALDTLLYRTTGQRDLPIGAPVAGRGQEETEGLIGCFVNVLVLRSRLAPDATFADLLAACRDTWLQAHAHAEMPFERLVDELQPKRSLSHGALFQVALMVQQDAAPPRLELPDLRLSALGRERETVNFELTLAAIESGEALSLAFEYNTDLFDATTAERLLRQVETLLASAAADPARRIDELDLLTAAERHQLVREWNDSRRPFPSDACVHDLVLARAAAVPDAVAVHCGDRHLSYGALVAHAAGLARRLTGLGVAPGERVAVLLDRSPELAVALLGVLLAGAAFVPLDPDYPAERLGLLLADSRVPLVLTRKRLAHRLPAACEARVVELDGEPPAADPAPFAGRVDPALTAYAIYTSGSTGRPKGSLIQHRALTAYALAAAHRFRLRRDDRFLQFAALGFDVLVEELFPAWLSGATVVLDPDGRIALPSELSRLVAERQVTGFEIPTAYWNEWVRDVGQAALPDSLRAVVIGGENPSPTRLAAWRRRHRVPLFNAYGLTEVTVTSLVHELPPAGRGAVHDGFPVGRPLDNHQVLLLDGRQRPVPLGVSGELWIGGEGVGHGYLERPALTADRFRPHPLASEPGQRAFRTGDWARRLWDGQIEFSGRRDHQVKLRGYRVELGEVEAALLRHPAVREAVVILREDRPGDRRLVAYWTAAGELAETTGTAEGPATAVRELRRHLGARLPDYMVPSRFVCLPELPLSAHGKVDRRALPAPGEDRPELESGYMAPRSDLERELAELWSEVLRVERVGVEDDFFALGGHSLLATRLLARVVERFRVDLPLMRIFESPTVAALAVTITEARAAASGGAELDRLLAELDRLSDDEARALLQGEDPSA